MAVWVCEVTSRRSPRAAASRAISARTRVLPVPGGPWMQATLSAAKAVATARACWGLHPSARAQRSPSASSAGKNCGVRSPVSSGSSTSRPIAEPAMSSSAFRYRSVRSMASGSAKVGPPSWRCQSCRTSSPRRSQRSSSSSSKLSERASRPPLGSPACSTSMSPSRKRDSPPSGRAQSVSPSSARSRLTKRWVQPVWTLSSKGRRQTERTLSLPAACSARTSARRSASSAWLRASRGFDPISTRREE